MAFSIADADADLDIDIDIPEPYASAPLDIPARYLREEAPQLPEVAEIDIVRHYTQLADENYSVDNGFYPLGSCTMKYNPKLNEDVSRLPGFAHVHPYQPEPTTQGALRVMAELSSYLCTITGMDAFSLQPAAGAHGELTGAMIIQAYFCAQGEDEASRRRKIIVPDSSHGTNPATTTSCGFETIEIASDARGGMDLGALRATLEEEGETIAGLMLTNPNTLGVFDENIEEICALVHEYGGLNYCDGANMNAILGVARPAEMGFDIIHLNLHKTFSTPHGGGGPGSGPVGVVERLAGFLPVPLVVERTDAATGAKQYKLDDDRPHSIGKVRGFYGNFGVIVRAWTYIRQLGARGLRRVAENAVLNANYLMGKLKGRYALPFDRICKHEFVLAGAGRAKETGVRTMDIAKRLIDYGYHPPTVYFPLIVDEAMMIEPTETESKETLDGFAAALLAIADEAEKDPALVTGAPRETRLGRLDDVRASRKPDLRWGGEGEVKGKG